MRGLLLAFLCFIATTAIPFSASAIEIEITYEITGGSNASTVFGGLAPLGGRATIRWSLTSLNGTFIQSATATLRSLYLSFTPGFFSTGPLNPGLQYLETIVFTSPFPPGVLATVKRVRGIWTAPGGPFTLLPISAVGRQSGNPASPPAPLSQLTTITINLPYSIGAFGPLGISANGQEVSRAIVPEPAPSALLALGLCALAAARTLRRGRGQRETGAPATAGDAPDAWSRLGRRAE